MSRYLLLLFILPFAAIAQVNELDSVYHYKMRKSDSLIAVGNYTEAKKLLDAPPRSYLYSPKFADSINYRQGWLGQAITAESYRLALNSVMLDVLDRREWERNEYRKKMAVVGSYTATFYRYRPLHGYSNLPDQNDIARFRKDTIEVFGQGQCPVNLFTKYHQFYWSWIPGDTATLITLPDSTLFNGVLISYSKYPFHYNGDDNVSTHYNYVDGKIVQTRNFQIFTDPNSESASTEHEDWRLITEVTKRGDTTLLNKYSIYTGQLETVDTSYQTPWAYIQKGRIQQGNNNFERYYTSSGTDVDTFYQRIYKNGKLIETVFSLRQDSIEFNLRTTESGDTLDYERTVNQNFDGWQVHCYEGELNDSIRCRFCMKQMWHKGELFQIINSRGLYIDEKGRALTMEEFVTRMKKYVAYQYEIETDYQYVDLNFEDWSSNFYVIYFLPEMKGPKMRYRKRLQKSQQLFIEANRNRLEQSICPEVPAEEPLNGE